MNQLPVSGAEYAERFGQACRSVLRGESWVECRASIRKSWDALAGIHQTWKAQTITWEEAQPHIHKAWGIGDRFDYN